MIVRVFQPSDLDELKRIHSEHFASEFEIPDFTQYLNAFVVEDEKGIITFAGIRDIAECVTVTDKSRCAKDRAKALINVLDVSVFTCAKMGYDQIYAWSQSPQWAKRLVKTAGFKTPKGQSLILDL